MAMLSALEAIDGEDYLQGAPVLQQGGFQPKVKPRARKVGSRTGQPPSSSPASKTENSITAASTSASCDRKSQDNATKLQKEAKTENGMQPESHSTAIACDGFNKVGTKTQQTHLSGDTDPEINLSFDGDAVSDCQRSPALRGHIAFAKVSAYHVNPVVEVSEDVDVSSQVSLEQDSVLSLNEGNDEELPTAVGSASLPVAGVLGLHACMHVNPVSEHTTDVGRPCEQPLSSMECVLQSVPQELAELSEKKEESCKDKQNALEAVEGEGCVTWPKDSSAIGEGVSTACDLESMENIEKIEERDQSDAKDQEDTVFAEENPISQKMIKRAKANGILIEVSRDEEAPKHAAQPVKKQKTRSKHAEGTRDEGITHVRSTNETSSTNTTSLTTSVDICPLQTSTQTRGLEESTEEVAGFAATNQQAKSHIDEHGEPGEAYVGLGLSKRKRRKPARYLDGADDGVIVGASPLVAKENGRPESQVDTNGQDEVGDDDLLSKKFPSLLRRVPKPQKSKSVGFNLNVDPSSSQVSMEAQDERNGSGEAVAPLEDTKKKKFKKFIQRRKKVERCAINPADPDLNPKKMTMKDIIRLAEAKDRMLKKDSAENAKNSNNQVTMDEPEREPETFESTIMAPQVQIIDGRIVINEESLVIHAQPKDDIRTYRRVEETHSKLNYHSYMKRTRKHAWRPDETELFYQALREFGTNFEMIQHLFPGRTRKHVLLKFKKEEKCSPLRIAEAMRVKPCDTSRFVEVMTSLNLLPSEMVDEVDSGQALGAVEQSFTIKESLDDSGSLRQGDTEMEDGAGHVFQLNEPPVVSMCEEETCDRIGSSLENFEALDSCHEEKQGVTMEEAMTPPDETKPTERATGDPVVPKRKKSLFSYQASVDM